MKNTGCADELIRKSRASNTENFQNSRKNESFTVKELKSILDLYQPQSYWRQILSFFLGHINEFFKYSVPIYNLRDLCLKKDAEGKYIYEDSRNAIYKDDNTEITRVEIESALTKTSWSDLNFKKRNKYLNSSTSFFDENKKTSLNTKEVIEKVLNKVSSGKGSVS